jgi:hypothetical protein
MSILALSVPTVLVNNIPFAIVPNTFEFENGYGEINVRSASIGGGAGVSVHTENAENKIGMVKFQLFVTPDSRTAVQGWKQLIGANLVTATQKNGIPVVLAGASMTNNPTFVATADGSVEIEFRGDPMPTP